MCNSASIPEMLERLKLLRKPLWVISPTWTSEVILRLQVTKGNAHQLRAIRERTRPTSFARWREGSPGGAASRRDNGRGDSLLRLIASPKPDPYSFLRIRKRRIAEQLQDHDGAHQQLGFERSQQCRLCRQGHTPSLRRQRPWRKLW